MILIRNIPPKVYFRTQDSLSFFVFSNKVLVLCKASSSSPTDSGKTKMQKELWMASR